MAIDEKGIEALERFVELPEGKKLSDLISGDEKNEIKLNSDLKIFTSDEHTKLIDDHRAEGETAGREILLKKMRDKAELQYEGVKNPDLFVEHLTKKVTEKALADAKIEPDEKIQTLNKDLDILRGKIEQNEITITGLNTERDNKDKETRINTFIKSAVPEKTKISHDEVVTLTRAKIDLRFEEDKPVVYKNGEVVKNDSRLPVDALEHIKTITAQYAEDVKGGKGKPDEVPNGVGTYDAFVKEQNENNIGEGSEAFLKEAQKRVKDGTLKM